MKIVVIIPTYNEKVNIEKMIPLLETEIFPQIKNHQMHVLVADDTSPDGTAEVVKQNQKKWKNLHLIKGKKEGLGVAYARAMKYAMKELEADAVIEFDADFQHDPHDIPKLVAGMDEGYDYVIGSRYVPGGAIPKEWAIHRKFLSYFGSLFARIVWMMFSVHDMTGGFKLTKTEYLKKIDLDHLYSKTFAYKLHIMHDIIKLGAKVKEVPIIFYERKEGVSKIIPSESLESFYVVLRLRWDDSKRLIKFLFVGGSGFIFQVIIQEISFRSGFTLFLAQILASYGLVQDLTSASNFFAAGFGAEAAIVSNFLLNNFWTFSDTRSLKQKSHVLTRAIRFNVASLGSIIIQAIAVYFGVKLLGPQMHIFAFQAPTRIAILIPTIVIIVIPLNYFLYNVLIWKTHHLKHETVKNT